MRKNAAADPLFPHHPTSDQFFDESQFESYRRLGLHVVEEFCVLRTARLTNMLFPSSSPPPRRTQKAIVPSKERAARGRHAPIHGEIPAI